MSLLNRRSRRGAAAFDLVSLVLVSGLAVSALWPSRDAVQVALDQDARAVTRVLLEGRHQAHAAARPMLVEVDPRARIVRVAIDRNNDNQPSRSEITEEVILDDDVLFGLPSTMQSRPFGAAPLEGRVTPAGTVVLRLETSDRVSRPSGFYLTTARALRAGATHGDEVLAVELAGSEGPVAVWRPAGDGAWKRRF